MVVHLEVFTSWATRASPLHGFIDPTARGMPRRRPFRSSGEGTVEKGTVIIWIRGTVEKGTVII